VPFVATIVSGFVYALAFPTRSLHLLAWVALVPWLVAMRSGSSARAIVLAWLWTVSSSYGLNDWFPGAVSTYYVQPAWVGAGLFLAVASFTAAPAFVLFALAWRRLTIAPTAATPLLAAAAWVGAELFRTKILGDPWALLGYSQVPVPALLQIAELAGVYGTSFLLAAVNAAIALRWTSTSRASWYRGLALVGVCTLVVGAGGVLRMRAIDATSATSTTPIAIVQADLDLGSQWRSEFYGANLDAYLRLTHEALGRDPVPRLVVWPESALSFFLDDEPLYQASIGSVLAASRTELVTGGPRTAGDKEPPFYNTTFLLEPTGAIRAWYDKLRLLPFAEYFPLGSVALLQRQFGRVREFTPGVATPPLPTVAGPVGVVVCNEALFAEPSGERVRDGAELLFALANDSWVGDVKYAEQATAMTVVRAIEQRRWLVRASTAGPSAIVAPTGRVVARSPNGTKAVVAGAVGRMTTMTPYGTVGDLFAIICGVAAVIAVVRARDRVS
jgi:apolipoprotein N-acyltransferase